MLAGLTLGCAIALRLIWGFFGSTHARFSGFALNPKDLVSYAYGMVSGNKRRWAGHNPASSWASLAMILCGIGLCISGYLMTSGANKEDFEDIHEIFSTIFIILVLLHILGLIIHTLRHKELIGLSMIDGKKESVPEHQAIPNKHIWIALLMLSLLGTFAFNLFRNFDQESGFLNLGGISLQIGSIPGTKEELTK